MQAQAASDGAEQFAAAYNGGRILLLGVTEYQLEQLPTIITEVKEEILGKSSRYFEELQKMEKERTLPYLMTRMYQI